MAIQEIKIPDIGDFNDVEIIEVLIQVGDSVNKDDSLITLESDKASMEIPSPVSGVIKEMTVKLGDRVSKGTLIAQIEASEESAAASSKESVPEMSAEGEDPKADVAKEAPQLQSAEQNNSAPLLTTTNAVEVETGTHSNAVVPDNRPATSALYHASPKVRRLASSLGVDLANPKGTGPNGRIKEQDVRDYVKSALSGQSQSGMGIPTIPEIDFSQFGEIEEVQLSRIKKLSGKHLKSCWLNVPHVTQCVDADITDLEAFRQTMKVTAEKAGVRLTPLAIIIKAVAAALKENPILNASLKGDNLIMKKYFHIGIAVDTPNGLVVPVIRNVDSKGVLELAGEMADVSVRARDGKLTPTDLSGAGFSVSSLGGIGGSYFTPIVNAPEVGILGVGRSSMQPVWDGASFQPRLMLPLSISYDHRVVDGAQGARFAVSMSKYLSDIRTLVL